MPEKQTKKDRKLAQRSSAEVDGSPGGPATFRQQEVFPAAVELTTASRFAGPLPPPDLLAAYEQVIPGLAERIVMMAEREGEHRRGLQRRAMRLSEWGLIAAFVIAMTAISGGIYLVREGSSREGTGSIMVAFATLLLVSLARGRRRPGDRQADTEP